MAHEYSFSYYNILQRLFYRQTISYILFAWWNYRSWDIAFVGFREKVVLFIRMSCQWFPGTVLEYGDDGDKSKGPEYMCQTQKENL